MTNDAPAKAIEGLGAVEVGPGKYRFEHQVWCGDEHGWEHYDYTFTLDDLDYRALTNPLGAAFEAWLREKCKRITADLTIGEEVPA